MYGTSPWDSATPNSAGWRRVAIVKTFDVREGCRCACANWRDDRGQDVSPPETSIQLPIALPFAAGRGYIRAPAESLLSQCLSDERRARVAVALLVIGHPRAPPSRHPKATRWVSTVATNTRSPKTATAHRIAADVERRQRALVMPVRTAAPRHPAVHVRRRLGHVPVILLRTIDW